MTASENAEKPRALGQMYRLGVGETIWAKFAQMTDEEIAQLGDPSVFPWTKADLAAALWYAYDRFDQGAILSKSGITAWRLRTLQATPAWMAKVGEFHGLIQEELWQRLRSGGLLNKIDRLAMAADRWRELADTLDEQRADGEESPTDDDGRLIPGLRSGWVYRAVTEEATTRTVEVSGPSGRKGKSRNLWDEELEDDGDAGGEPVTGTETTVKRKVEYKPNTALFAEMAKLEKMAMEMLGEMPGREVNASGSVAAPIPLAPPEVRYSVAAIASVLGIALQDRSGPDVTAAIEATVADVEAVE